MWLQAQFARKNTAEVNAIPFASSYLIEIPGEFSPNSALASTIVAATIKKNDATGPKFDASTYKAALKMHSRAPRRMRSIENFRQAHEP